MESDGEALGAAPRPPGARSFVSLAVEHGVVAAPRAPGVPVADRYPLEPDGGPFRDRGLPDAPRRGRVGRAAGAPPRRVRAARERLVAQLGEALARIHSIGRDDVDGVRRARTATRRSPPATFWESALDDVGEPLPATEAGLRWLRLNAPAAGRAPRSSTAISGSATSSSRRAGSRR